MVLLFVLKQQVYMELPEHKRLVLQIKLRLFVYMFFLYFSIHKIKKQKEISMWQNHIKNQIGMC